MPGVKRMTTSSHTRKIATESVSQSIQREECKPLSTVAVWDMGIS